MSSQFALANDEQNTANLKKDIPTNSKLLFTNNTQTSISSDSHHSKSTAEIARLIEKDWWGAAAEIGTILLLGEALYQAGGSSMERDFDYEIEGNDLEYFHDRIFTKKYWKLDDNTMGMNWGHAYAGMIYYQAFRNHNFNYYESTLATFIASTAWEAVVEYKEVVSINDQIVTTWGGAVLGESLYQLNEMLTTKQGWLPYSFAALFNPAQTIQGWFGAQKSQRFNRTKVNDIFNVYTGTMHTSNDTRNLDKTMLIFGLNASIDSMQGQFDSLVGTPTLVEMNVEAGLSEEGLEDFQLTNSLVLGGYYQRTATADMSHDAWQQTYFIGPAVGVEYASFGDNEDEEDFYAVINALGVSMGADWQNDDMRFVIRGSIHGDFAMIKPFASHGVENYRDFYWNSKSALWENAYAYALGHTANLKFEASYRDLRLGLSIRSQRWDSIDNKKIERYGDWNPNLKDLDFKDSRDRYLAYIHYQMSQRLTLGVHYEQIHRSGEFFGIDNPDFYAQASDVESRSWVQLNYSY